ncbi:MAG: S16 family serine protease [Sulfolobales archaeon]
MLKVTAYITLLFLILNLTQVFPLHAYGLDRSNQIHIVAVNQLSNGSYAGVIADLYVRVVCPGFGHVFVETLPLSQIDLQASTRVAALVASRVAGIDFTRCDYYASISADSPIVGGPSASAVTSAVFSASLIGVPINRDIIMTGMIMPDGSVGPVGGLKAKLDAAASIGAKKFLVPYGQTYDVEYVTVEERRGNVVIYRTQQRVVDLIEYGRKLGIDVIPVANVYEALEILTNGLYKTPNATAASVVLEKLQSRLEPMFAKWVRNISNEAIKYVNEGDSLRDEVLRALSGSKAAYVKNLLNSVEASIKETLSKATELEKQHLLYAASSAYFQALTYAKWRLHLLKSVLSDGYLVSEAQKINNSIKEAINNVHNAVNDYVDVAAIDVFSNVLERAYDALLYLNISMSSQDLSTATYYLGLADSRAYTSRLWLELLEYASSYRKNLSVKDFSNMVVNIESLIQNIYTYILAFSDSVSIPSDTFNEAYSRYVLMRSLSNDLDRFAVGLSSLGYMYLTLTSMFTNNYSSSVEALNKTISSTLSLLGDLTPIDAVAYIELAKAYGFDPQYQTYMLARLSMLLATYLNLKYLGVSAPNAQLTTPASECPTAIRETVTKTEVVTETVTVKEPVNITAIKVTDSATSITALLLILLLIVLLFFVRTPEKFSS